MEYNDDVKNYLFDIRQRLKDISTALYQYYSLRVISYEELWTVVEESTGAILDFGRFVDNLSIEATSHSHRTIFASIVTKFSNIVENEDNKWRKDELICGAFCSIDNIMDNVTRKLRKVSFIPYRIPIDNVL